MYNAFGERSHCYYGNAEVEKAKRPLLKHYSHDGSVEIVCNKTDNSTKFVFYLGGDAYSAPAILISDGEVQKLYYLHRDYLGSIVMLTDEDGNIAERRHFDPWGQPIKVEDGAGKVLQGLTLLDRGFTGHEHLQTVGLIHMNGRLYDPALHRFLQPDNYVQDPFNTQNFNRYGYCLNNPLVYVDQNGEFWHLVIGAVVGGVINWATHGAKFSAQGLGYFGVGALAGALSAGVMGGTSSALAGGAFSAGFLGSSSAAAVSSSFFSGAVIGAASGLTGGITSGIGNSLVSGQNIGQALKNGINDGLTGTAFGAITGGIAGGIDAVIDGRNFWRGDRKILDVDLPIPQVNQIGDYDCTYACAESIDKYYGNNRTQSYFTSSNPSSIGQGLTNREIGRMYANAGYRTGSISIDKANPVNTIREIANNMSKRTAVSLTYDTGIKAIGMGGQKFIFAHATVINRVRLYDSGRFIINVMNPSSNSSTNSFRTLNNMFLIFSIR